MATTQPTPQPPNPTTDSEETPPTQSPNPTSDSEETPPTQSPNPTTDSEETPPTTNQQTQEPIDPPTTNGEKPISSDSTDYRVTSTELSLW